MNVYEAICQRIWYIFAFFLFVLLAVLAPGGKQSRGTERDESVLYPIVSSNHLLTKLLRLKEERRGL